MDFINRLGGIFKSWQNCLLITQYLTWLFEIGYDGVSDIFFKNVIYTFYIDHKLLNQYVLSNQYKQKNIKIIQLINAELWKYIDIPGEKGDRLPMFDII